MKKEERRIEKSVKSKWYEMIHNLEEKKLKKERRRRIKESYTRHETHFIILIQKLLSLDCGFLCNFVFLKIQFKRYKIEIEKLFLCAKYCIKHYVLVCSVHFFIACILYWLILFVKLHSLVVTSNTFQNVIKFGTIEK